MRRPHILIVMIDSLRADRASCYGYGRPTTPNLDRLAAEGCLFERAITAAPFSPASYAAMMSNLYPHQHGVNGDVIRRWPEAWPRLPELLRERGYFTYCISNNSFVTEEMNATRGFDEFVDLQAPTPRTRFYERVMRRVRIHFGADLARRLTPNSLYCREKGNSLQSVRRAADRLIHSTKPSFGFVILMDPHTPYRRTRTRFAADLAAVRRFFRERNNSTMWTEFMARDVRLPAAELAAITDIYDAEVHYADECVGQLVSALQAGGKLDDTLLVVSADHGEAFGEHGVWGHGFSLHDTLTRVPLVARHPQLLPAGRRCPQLVQLHDLFPTAIACADDDPLGDPASLIRAQDASWGGREAAFSHFPVQTRTLEFMREINPTFVPGRWAADVWAIRTRDWRLIEYTATGECELFDLRRDPPETCSVLEAHPEQAAELRQRLAAFREDRPLEVTPPPAEESELLNERLRALGYI
jgi:arylsulfatase A-like enzyme